MQEAVWKDKVKVELKQISEINFRISKKLTDIRLETKRQLKKVDALFESGLSSEDIHHFQNEVFSISKYCTDQMIQLTHDIMKDSVELMEESLPCSFSVVVFGSMAKGEATPYSDLEYMFLVEDSCEENLKYFELLAIISYFLMV